MIRSNEAPERRRRIAVVEIPRNELTRLGRLGVIRDAATTYSGIAEYSGVYPTITNEPPSDAARWLAQKVQEQSTARDTTPGTLTYTPAPVGVAAPIVGSWNSWQGPCSGTPGPTISTTPAAAAPSQHRFLWYLAAGLGAAASAAYLIESAKGRNR